MQTQALMRKREYRLRRIETHHVAFAVRHEVGTRRALAKVRFELQRGFEKLRTRLRWVLRRAQRRPGNQNSQRDETDCTE